MAKEVINVDGEDKVVREDTARAYRGTIWGLTIVGAFIVIAAIMFLWFFSKSATDNKPNETPQQIDQKSR